jgi:hypothetical protein
LIFVRSILSSLLDMGGPDMAPIPDY